MMALRKKKRRNDKWITEMPMEEINLGSRDISDGRMVAVVPGHNSKGMNANSYATKKTVAQGMLDIALLTANASQLKYVLQVGEQHEFYILMIILISVSILLQVLVGIGFLIIGNLNIEIPEQHKTANRLNNTLTGSVFIITVINILISAFGMKQSDDQREIEVKP